MESAITLKNSLVLENDSDSNFWIIFIFWIYSGCAFIAYKCNPIFATRIAGQIAAPPQDAITLY